MRRFAALPILLLFAVPLVFSVALVLPAMLRPDAWLALVNHPQFEGALHLTLFTGLSSTAVSFVLAVIVISNMRQSFAARAGSFLSVPHLAFAIGLGFLIMPAGVLARLIAPVMGWVSPPPWITTQDPYGLALTAALVLKETPFLVWAFTTVLNREDLRNSFAGQRAVAASLGHGPVSTFIRVILPQLLPRVIWPLVSVLAYGLTVVDMTLVIGPTQPPTLAQLIWTDLNDADVVNNARGAAGVLALSALILIVLFAVAAGVKITRPSVARFWSTGPAQRRGKGAAAAVLKDRSKTREIDWIWSTLLIIYVAVVATLVLQSFAGLWPFPKLLPLEFSLSAWRRVLENLSPLSNSVVLAVATAMLSLLAAVAWFESVAESRDRWLLWLAAFALCLPALVIGLGQYRLFLTFGIAGTATAMFLAHVLPVAAYVLIMLQGPYRGFDDRYRAVASGLRAGTGHFLLQVKWPMLKSALLSAFAVGFAVSMAQYVPAQLASAGRYTTLPMEAVTLTSGGNRALTAAYGLLMMALPLLVFATSGLLSRSRWRAM